MRQGQSCGRKQPRAGRDASANARAYEVLDATPFATSRLCAVWRMGGKCEGLSNPRFMPLLAFVVRQSEERKDCASASGSNPTPSTKILERKSLQSEAISI